METLLYLSPELILMAFALLIFALDLVWRERAGDRLNWVALVGLIAAFAATLLVIMPGQSWAVFCAACPKQILPDTNPAQIRDAMYVSDLFTNFFRLIATITGLIVLLLTFEYLKGRTKYRGEFIGLFLLAISAMILMGGSTNLLMIYLSTEFLSYTSYLLTGFFRDDRKSNEAAIKYFLYGAVTSAVMLYGISLFYGATGSLDLLRIREVFTGINAPQGLGLFAVGLMLAGFGFKISLVPFHQWAPDAYEGAPTPVTAFLSVGPKSAGFAILIRVLMVGALPFQAGWVGLLTVIAILTMTVGNVIALNENNLKRLFAYSSIAQAGYMLIGLASISLNPKALYFDGVSGVLLYLFAYLFTNLGAFICIVAIENATGATEISQYGGMIRRSPWLAVLLTIFFLSLAGIPPTAGFIGKFFVFMAALNAQQYVLASIGVLNSVLSVFYYFRVVRPMFFETGAIETTFRTGGWLRAALAVTTVMVFLVALVPTPFLYLSSRGFWEMFGMMPR